MGSGLAEFCFATFYVFDNVKGDLMMHSEFSSAFDSRHERRSEFGLCPPRSMTLWQSIVPVSQTVFGRLALGRICRTISRLKPHQQEN